MVCVLQSAMKLFNHIGIVYHFSKVLSVVLGGKSGYEMEIIPLSPHKSFDIQLVSFQ